MLQEDQEFVYNMDTTTGGLTPHGVSKDIDYL